MPRRSKGQHFLLSAQARTLSLLDVTRMTNDEARESFRLLRWASTGGKPVCPHCNCTICYEYASRPIFKCKSCNKQFSVTSGTLFHGRKLAFRDYLAAIVIFINAAKGISALQLSRDLDVQYKTAFVLAHKLREAMASETRHTGMNGVVEVDGCWVGGHVRPANLKSERIDRRLAENQTGKRRCVVVIRERGGRTRTFALASEAEGVALIKRHVVPGAVIHADEAECWNDLHAQYEMRRINHQQGYSIDGACTNGAEGYFSRFRRAEWGQYHHLGGIYLGRYAAEIAWREDRRRQSNGVLFSSLGTAALNHSQSVDWTGYWQRRKEAA